MRKTLLSGLVPARFTPACSALVLCALTALTLPGLPAADSEYTAAVIADEPLFYWSFDEAGDQDPAVNLVSPLRAEDSLQPGGAATRVDHATIGSDPILGRAAQFDGAQGTRFYAADVAGTSHGPGGDYIATQLWVLEFWFQATGSPDGQRGDYLVDSAGNDPAIILDFTLDDYLEMYGRGGHTEARGPQVSDSQWHHLVLAFYGNSGGFGIANRRDIVLDGVVYTDRDSTFSAGFSLMAYAVGNCVEQGGINPFEGLIDEMALYDVGGKLAEGGFDISTQNLEAEQAFEDFVLEIAAHETLAGAPGYGQAVLDAEPLFYWSFDEAGDTDPAVNLADPEDLGDRLLAQGQATRADHTALGSGLLLGRAARFDGAAGTRFFAENLDAKPGERSLDMVPSMLWALELWFQVEGLNDGNRSDYFLESIGEGSTNNPGIIYDYTPDTIEIFGPGGRTGDLGPQVADGEWHHLVLGFYGRADGFGAANRRDIILDGRVFTETVSGLAIGFALVELAVGNTVAGGGQNGFEGRIDEVAIYDIGSKLALQGFDIGAHNPDAEAAFEEALLDIADHRTLVSGTCSEEADGVEISGPATGVPGGSPVALSAAFTGLDPGGSVTYFWTISSGTGTIQDKGGGTAELMSDEIGEVIVLVEADDGVCPDLGAVRDTHAVCFETPDAVSIAGPTDAFLGDTVVLTASFTGRDPAYSSDRTSGFSSGFGLVELAVGNSAAGGGVDGFEGRMDEFVLYDVGTQLAAEGIDISTQNSEAEAAFEEVVRRIAEHSRLDGQDFSDAVLSESPILYWSFDEPGDADPAVNLADPGSASDWLSPQGAATRVDHDAIESGLDLGRAADFDGAAGTRFYAPDLKGPGIGPGLDVVASQLWVLEFWFQVKGSTAVERRDYFAEVIGPGGVTNNPGVIYDFTADDYIELFRGERTGTAGPQVSDNRWHHVVFAFYGDSAGLGVANRREIIVDGGDLARYEWSVVSGAGTVTDLGGGTAEVVSSAPEETVVRVVVGDGACDDTAADEHTIAWVVDGLPVFHRGDANGDGSINITDGIFVLNYLFLGGPKPPCLEAANPNDDATINITDGIYVLNYLFLGGPTPADPGPVSQPCGTDPAGSPSNLGCELYMKC